MHSARVYSHLRGHLFSPAVPSVIDDVLQVHLCLVSFIKKQLSTYHMVSYFH